MAEAAEFLAPGAPQGKGRPRYTRNGAPYTPKKTACYEASIRERYLAEHGRKKLSGPIAATIVAKCPVPKSASKKRAQGMLAGSILPTGRPDMDNVVKAALDALNGVAFGDDAQIVCIVAAKVYAAEPGLRIALRQIDAEAAADLAKLADGEHAARKGQTPWRI